MCNQKSLQTGNSLALLEINFFINITPVQTKYLLASWCRVLLEQLTGLQLVKKFPAFHGTRRFITALKSVRHLSLSWASPVKSIYPHPTSWRSVPILSTHLRLGLPSGFFPSGFPTKTLYTPFSSPIRTTCPAHLTLLEFITRTILGEVYKSFSSSLWKYKQRDNIQMKDKAVPLRKHRILKSYSVEVCRIHLLLATALNEVATVEF